MSSASSSRETVLGGTGLQVCRLGMGGIPIQRLDQRRSDRVLESALAAGINFFDTARIYTDSESKFGRVLPRHRQRVVVASKTLSRQAGQVAMDIDTSLRHLRTDCIDLYQCHNVATQADLEDIMAPRGALEALQRAQTAGKIKHIGITGHKPWFIIQALQAFDFATIQVPCNHIETGAVAELIPLARRRRVGVIAMKPIGGGNIRQIGLNFRFIFNSGVDVAIPGMDSSRQVTENIAWLDKLAPLTAGDIRRLQKEKDRLGENFCRRCEYCMPCPQGLPIAFLHVLKNYYFLYDLKDWVRERLQALPKTFQDCTACRTCVQKCPYHLDSPEIFKQTWQRIQADRG